MPIELATDSDTALMSAIAAPPGMDADEDTFSEADGTDSYNFRQIVDMLYADKDLIFTIPADQEVIFKTGVSVRKAKDTQKLKDAGITGASETFSFLVYKFFDSENKEVEGQIKIRVKLGPKKSVTILKIERPDDEL